MKLLNCTHDAYKEWVITLSLVAKWTLSKPKFWWADDSWTHFFFLNCTSLDLTHCNCCYFYLLPLHHSLLHTILQLPIPNFMICTFIFPCCQLLSWCAKTRLNFSFLLWLLCFFHGLPTKDCWLPSTEAVAASPDPICFRPSLRT